MIFTAFLWQYQSAKHLYLEKEKKIPSCRPSLKILLRTKKSGEFRLSHHIDKKTGMYNGKQIFKNK